MVYIDNLFIIGKDLNIINCLKKKLLKRVCMTDLGSVSHYLHISITQTKNFMSLNQENYLEKLLLQFGMDTYKSALLQIDLRVLNSMLPVSKNEQVDKDIIF